MQKTVIGRIISGKQDTLNGYRKSKMQFADGVYPVIISDSSAFVCGLLLELTPAELSSCDKYEGDDYCRFKVTLLSGIYAWVYSATPKHLSNLVFEI